MEFSHLHVHTQYSLLDGAAGIKPLMAKAKQYGMGALAITDHGNMYGVPEFVNEARKNEIKPIIGCEFYIANGSMHERSKRVHSENAEKSIFHQVLLAKNETGYKNISRLCSAGFIDGFYYKPRIDKELLRKHSEGLIATTCCLASEVNQAILRRSEEEAEKLFEEWLDIFGEDYYIELQRHGIKEQDQCNEVLIKWSRKYNVKMIATNDVHYIDAKDSEAQDILLCLQTGKDYDDPNRMRFDGDQFFLKTQQEMEELFKDVPEAIDNTAEIVSKIDTPELSRDILLPIFDLPEGFTSEDEYLRKLTLDGAKVRYPNLTPEITERINYELKIIEDMGFAGYFLITQDFVIAAKKLGVSVGPGRGSAAGSVVAYCTLITNIDPIKYDLLFERFLNPERVSMPDIDIDFDDDGRAKVIDWVVEKYGKNRVAQIITHGTMAAKSSIRDVARVLKLPLSEADRLAKLIPETPGVSLKQAFAEVKELADAKTSKDLLTVRTLGFAETLEGSVRHTGIHAAGVIIGREDLRELLPLGTAKNSDLLVTQYEGKYAEQVGMLKMDFLGLKTLSIIADAVGLIKKGHGVDIDIDNIPLDDAKTFELYQNGDTIGTFQFESEGMRIYLKDLQPTNMEDLIAMNALYRPGPMQFIPTFINRKHGKEKTEYPHELLEGILKNTYGIMVYQEQIMQAAQILGDYSLGEADILRRIMGKKKADLLPPEEKKFVERAVAKGIEKDLATKIFGIMAHFAGYGFNRSHSAAYSVVAYQTAYLKANYPAEYMASVLQRNKNDIKKITFFMDECKRMKIKVFGPDVNESQYKFSVNQNGEIRFGLGAVKGVGEAAANAIVEERENAGNFNTIFDLTKRIDLRAANKKCLESLAVSGAFDCFEGVYRSQYFFQSSEDDTTFLDKAVKFGNKFQNDQDSDQISMFSMDPVDVKDPDIPACEPWTQLEMLSKEKEITGMYLSGHPLDNFKVEVKNFCNTTLEDIGADLLKYKNREVKLAGIVTEAQHRTTKTGRPFGIFTIEDFTGTMRIALFAEDYLKMRHFLKPKEFLFISGKVELRYRSEDNWEFKAYNIELLSEIRAKLGKSITMQLSLEDVSDSFVEEITNLVNANVGQCTLNFQVGDKEENNYVEMHSSKFKVDINDEFLASVKELSGVEYKLN
ncbi:MAG: DNA polymerase III subunit alpha [Flavobacteriales bacterium]|nr:DNA polymerase III subunit alpha [Flavobacteriales bacterium]